MGEQLHEKPPDLSTWNPDQLIARVAFLEQQLKEQTLKYNSPTLSPKTPSPVRKPKNARVNREFDPSKYSTRLIALKFAYLGQRYNGLEFHPNNKTPLPTVEEELWKALNKARLVFPTPNPLLEPDEPNWEGCEYSKCGRTDKGVSAFGQVIGIRVRSNRPVNRVQKPASFEDAATGMGEPSHPKDLETPALPVVAVGEDATPTPSSASESVSDEELSFHPIRDEILYCQVLNRILPPDIRMLAWCPAPPADFSARFSCKERRYRYFFTQPAFTPTVGPAGLLSGPNKPDLSAGRSREGWLDIDAMREAAHKFIGLHDFRNFCKVDPSKQIENFERHIFHADIEEIDSQQGPVGYIAKPGFQQYEHSNHDPLSRLDHDLRDQSSTPTVYTFTLHGSAFLWHQVRHMVAILFLVGQGLEPPSVIDDLFDVSKTSGRPQHEMADDAPLVLWDCIFPREGANSRADAIEWVYVGDDTGGGATNVDSAKGAGKFGYGGVVDDLWRVWRARKMDEVLAGSLLDVVAGRASRGSESLAAEAVGPEGTVGQSAVSQKIFQGGDGPRFVGKYVPVMQKPRMESVEAINARYAKRKGFEQNEETRETGFRRVVSED
ncbi:MAG: hypothetical protein ALECFALPRED_002513 [Alectoria fallacina]|uniref:Pseudouridine synthase I TruA alpha/beta domain-containing protein n=1 Tax=Alectoria fallacina TaxID=1903189 RepID=A0A8H3FKN1_9LECA|nr:MAG: hypothetical protein ALECFALPRED_002513 [Alectoria fallacina]